MEGEQICLKKTITSPVDFTFVTEDTISCFNFNEVDACNFDLSTLTTSSLFMSSPDGICRDVIGEYVPSTATVKLLIWPESEEIDPETGEPRGCVAIGEVV